MKQELWKSLIYNINEKAKADLINYGYLDHIMFLKTSERLFCIELKWESLNEKNKIYRNCLKPLHGFQ
jgi:hypothetical protein